MLHWRLRSIVSFSHVIVFMCMKGVLPTCKFPEFLISPTRDGGERTWLTETKYADNSEKWESQLEISYEAMGSELVAKVLFEAQCSDFSGRGVPCAHRVVVWRKTCMEVTDDGKYFVRVHDNGKVTHTCLKFVQRNKNIVQVWESISGDYNAELYCQNHLLKRNEWPWISPEQEEWTPCPLTGGYDIAMFNHVDQNVLFQKLCPSVWRPSRLESDCIMGEGLAFIFPDPECSPFLDHKDVKLTCWGDWYEEDFRFVLAGKAEEFPQYILRVPTKVLPDAGFSAVLYFNPIAPDTKRGLPIARGNFLVVDLQLKRSEPGICFDESEMCQEYAREGKCTNAALHQYANYCKRSCGLCSLLPSNRAECRFPSTYEGDWMLFETNRKEKVTINEGRIQFSELGEFICKRKHWQYDVYTMLSYYSNGCRPRYTCWNFELGEDDLLEFKLSPSEASDQSFRNCEWQDDPPPLNNIVRSQDMKLLLPADRIEFDKCGLNGMIHVTDIKDNGLSCHGTLSDWNKYACEVEPKLRVSLHGQCSTKKDESLFFEDYICTAYVNFHDGFNILITQSTKYSFKEEYNCWIIKTYPERMAYEPWHEIYLLKGAQCGGDDTLTHGILEDALLALTTHTDDVNKPCDQITQPNYEMVTPKTFHRQRDATYVGPARSGTSVFRPLYHLHLYIQSLIIILLVNFRYTNVR